MDRFDRLPARRRAPASRVRSIAAWLSVSLALPLAGCAELFYSRMPTGGFNGKLTVEWIAPNQFIYRPDAQDPLTYRTSDGRVIRPQLMLTDGGSIPRLFWSAPSFAPWDFAPGYIVHDWLFHQHHCQLDDWQQWDFPRSASVLAEGIKTQMEKAGRPEPTVVWAIHQAVRSQIAERLWTEGRCEVPSASLSATPSSGTPAPVVILRIEAR